VLVGGIVDLGWTFYTLVAPPPLPLIVVITLLGGIVGIIGGLIPNGLAVGVLGIVGASLVLPILVSFWSFYGLETFLNISMLTFVVAYVLMLVGGVLEIILSNR